MLARAEGVGTHILTNHATQKVYDQIFLSLVLNACASVVVIESRVGVSMTRSFKVDGIQMSLWRVAWLTLSQMWEC
jgi:hypothetical protein